MKNEMNALLKIKKRLNRHASTLGLSYSCDFNFIKFEDDFVHFNIESRNTHKLSLRFSDCRLIGEGRSLESVGHSLASAYKVVLRELRAHAKFIALDKAARDSNCIVFRGSLVVCENIDSNEYLSNEGIFGLTLQDGTVSRWYGYSPENAINNAGPWLKETPVMITFLEERGA